MRWRGGDRSLELVWDSGGPQAGAQGEWGAAEVHPQVQGSWGQSCVLGEGVLGQEGGVWCGWVGWWDKVGRDGG